jgi:hypothetical protein
MVHPHSEVVAASAAAVKQLLLLMPQAALLFLPLVLYCLQHSTKSVSGAQRHKSVHTSVHKSVHNSISETGEPAGDPAGARAQVGVGTGGDVAMKSARIRC